MKNVIIETNKVKTKQMTISYHGVKLWNSIDTNNENCENDSSFKREYKVSLLSSELLWNA